MRSVTGQCYFATKKRVTKKGATKREVLGRTKPGIEPKDKARFGLDEETDSDDEDGEEDIFEDDEEREIPAHVDSLVRTGKRPRQATVYEHIPNLRIFSRRRHIRCSVKRMLPWTKLIRATPVNEAMIQMRFARSAKTFYIWGVLRNAQINATMNYGLDPNKVVVDSVKTLTGPMFKNVNPMGRGHIGLHRERYCHLYLYIREGVLWPTKDGKWKLVKGTSRKAIRGKSWLRAMGHEMMKTWGDEILPQKVAKTPIPPIWN